MKVLPSKVIVSRTPSTGRIGFRACVLVGERGRRNMKATGSPYLNSACAHGRNPRTAVARALRKAASTISTRSGAFRGMK